MIDNVSDRLWSIYFRVLDVDAPHAEFVHRSAQIDYGLCDPPYGCREFGVQDRDGYGSGFGQVVDAKKELAPLGQLPLRQCIQRIVNPAVDFDALAQVARAFAERMLRGHADFIDARLQWCRLDARERLA